MPAPFIALPWLAALGCGGPSPEPDRPGAPPTSSGPSPEACVEHDDTTTPDDLPPEFHVALEDFECAGGTTGCADESPYIEGTCCAYGSPLQHLGTGIGAEVVDLETNGTYTVLCGGFGADISDVSAPDDPVYVGGMTARCQRANFGTQRKDGTQVVYLAHHGDSWVDTPFLATYAISDGTIDEVHTEQTSAALFEGLFWDDDELYVATHATGLRVYDTSPDGTPTLRGTKGGFENATKLDGTDTHLFVADATVLRVLDRDTLSFVASLDAKAQIRDVDHHEGRVYLALGGDGLMSVDVSDPQDPEVLASITPPGSVQAVAATDDILATANWDHVEVLDPDSLMLLGSRKTRSYRSYEQDFGVALHDRDLHVGEWEGLHILRHREGVVAPDLWLSDAAFSFAADQADTQFLFVGNRGPLPLEIDEIVPGESSLAAQPASLTVEPGDLASVELTYTPPATNSSQLLSICTNDPDPEEAEVSLTVTTSSGGSLNVGDKLTDDFAFMDPTGQDDLANLEGKVIFIAYFALF